MENRRERRLAEKQLGLRKLEKTMSVAEREMIAQRKREYMRQQTLIRAQDAENLRISQEAEQWSKSLEKMIGEGMPREEAEARLIRNKELTDKRAADLAARKSRRKL